jgi:hypothetical protein
MSERAARLARPDPRQQRATRQRRYRQRQNAGEAVYRIAVKPVVIEALLARGMSEADSLDRARVAAELALVLAQWAAYWTE